MIVKTLEDITGTKGEAHGDKWHSMRLLHKEDGVGVTLTDSILGPGRMDNLLKAHT
jgi:L-ectoine synthase